MPFPPQPRDVGCRFDLRSSQEAEGLTGSQVGSASYPVMAVPLPLAVLQPGQRAARGHRALSRLPRRPEPEPPSWGRPRSPTLSHCV